MRYAHSTEYIILTIAVPKEHIPRTIRYNAALSLSENVYRINDCVCHYQPHRWISLHLA